MIGWWPGDGNSKDIQGGNTGTLKNGAMVGTGEIGESFSFDGNDDNVLIKDDASLHYADFTYDAWIAPDADSPEGDNYIICKGAVGTYEPLIAISGSAGAHYWHVFVDNIGLYGPNVTYNFQHVAVTRQGTTVKLYVDGVLYDTQTVSSANSADGYNLEFGNIPGYGSSFFKGRIDEVEIFSRALGIEEIQNIYVAGSYGKCRSCDSALSGLVGWWPGDGNTKDIASGNTGLLKNGAGFATAEVSQGFSLDGTDDYVEIADNPTVSLTGPFTIDAWIKTNDNTSEHAIVEKYDGGGTNGYFFRLTSLGQLTLGVCDGSGCSAVSGSTQVTTGTFHHVVGVFDGSSLNVYLDGNLDGGPNGSVAPTDGTNPLTIGARGGSVGNFFNGIIDEVEIFTRALSADEIQSLYDAGSVGKCKPECITPPSGLVGWWLGDIKGTDIKGGNKGTLNKVTTFG